jgi:hypothetical protein
MIIGISGSNPTTVYVRNALIDLTCIIFYIYFTPTTMQIKLQRTALQCLKSKNLTPWRDSNPQSFADTMTTTPRRQGLHIHYLQLEIKALAQK